MVRGSFSKCTELLLPLFLGACVCLGAGSGGETACFLRFPDSVPLPTFSGFLSSWLQSCSVSAPGPAVPLPRALSCRGLRWSVPWLQVPDPPAWSLCAHLGCSGHSPSQAHHLPAHTSGLFGDSPVLGFI